MSGWARKGVINSKVRRRQTTDVGKRLVWVWAGDLGFLVWTSGQTEAD